MKNVADKQELFADEKYCLTRAIFVLYNSWCVEGEILCE